MSAVSKSEFDQAFEKWLETPVVNMAEQESVHNTVSPLYPTEVAGNPCSQHGRTGVCTQHCLPFVPYRNGWKPL
ncbi:hypothetical protein PoB_005973900 [Plakobranchus ocellatus]|uniref:Uncharacterized protein n=1 Tax=Plakobranchus ocellatus TaxID=259542 RepID=A0AAV4CNA3_9GAST|nr:hypothetical protein PoB_005973900 [Plakobranchus ocellatus]